ncbi:MAG: hypothetical protein J6A25_09375 [Lachnospiraceae bacterium]|nr:hypothetical protein [Lachnospiraceae bacterium]
MSLQQGVNQLLGIGATALRLGPNYERNVELRKLSKQDVALGKQRELQESVGKTVLANNLTKLEALDDVIQEQANVAQKQFELKPSEKSYQKYSTARGEALQANLETEILRERIARSFERMRAAGQAKYVQKTRYQELRDSLENDDTFSRLGESAKDYIVKQQLKEDKDGK